MTLSVRRGLAATLASLLVLAGALVGAAPANAATSVSTVAGAPDSPFDYVEYDGLLYFAAIAEGDIYSSLFSYDGTTFTSIPGSPTGINGLTVFGGKLVISAVDDIDNPPFDYVLSTYDGSTFAPVAGGFVSPNDFVEAGGVLFFQADVAGTWGVWQFDGTTASAVPGAAGTSPSALSEFGGKLYFNGDADPTPGESCTLFSYDPAGVSPAAPVAGAPFEPGPLVAFDGLAYFGAAAGMFTFDGVSTFTPVQVAPAEAPFGLTVFDGALYFSSYDGTDYVPFVYSNGVTTRVPGGIGTETSDYAEYNGALYFLGFSGGDVVLAVIQGGVATVVPGAPTYAFDFVTFQGKLYFSADLGDARAMYVLETSADPTLASTGTDLRMPALIAFALLLLGAAALLATRTRTR